MASIHYRKSRDKWEVRWAEPQVVIAEDGTEVRSYKSRRRSAPTKKIAEQLKREIEAEAALGQAWEDQREAPVVTLDLVCKAYLAATVRGRPASTARYRSSVLQKFLTWAGEETPVSKLTTGMLGDYAQHLQAADIRSVSRYVGLVEQLWEWAHNRSDTYPGVPTPRRITGADNDVPHAPQPVAVDTPRWLDVDRLLHALTPEGAPKGEGSGYGYRPQWELHRRVALVQRFTGLRVSQILSLDWSDLDLDKHRLTIRAGRRGAKGQKRDRVVPLHKLLVAELAGWGKREGSVFGRVATKGKKRGQVVIPRGHDVAEVFTAAWQRAGVRDSAWSDAGDRRRGRPTNAIRARFKSQIAGAASYELATLLVGQSSHHGEHDAYVALGNPEASPYWQAMVEALATIPAVNVPTPDNVVDFRAAGGA